jgi:methylmalonyl-CoA mutase
MNNRTDLLFAEFPSCSYEDWKKAAAEELKNQDPEQQLAWQIADIQGKPYYHATPYTFSLPVPQPCANLPQVSVHEPAIANEKSLQHLQGGAEGIFFKVNAHHIHISQLLEGIEWPWCNLSFYCPAPDEAFIEAMQNFLKKKNFTPHTLQGAFYFQSYPQHSQVLHKIVHTFSVQSKVFPLGIVLPNHSFTQSIAEGLYQAVSLVNTLQTENLPVARLISSIAFAVELGTDFFLEIARLRALRWLWFQVARAWGVSHYQPSDVFIHGISATWSDEAYQPHANLIKGTVSAMAAIAGGANALTVIPEQEDDSRLARLARNVPLLLKEESRFHEVSDPLSGSWYVENITAQMAEKAWQKFQNLLRA